MLGNKIEGNRRKLPQLLKGKVYKKKIPKLTLYGERQSFSCKTRKKTWLPVFTTSIQDDPCWDYLARILKTLSFKKNASRRKMNVLKIKSRKPQQNNEIYKKEPKENVRTENYNN